MKIDFAFLADAAQASPDGKFSVIGGGLTAIYAQKFPTLLQALALVVKLIATKDEVGLEHNLRIELINPLQVTAMPPLGGKFTIAPNLEHPDWPITAQFVITIAPIVFEIPGSYTLRFSVDSILLKTLTLYAVTQPAPTFPLATQVNPLTQEDV